MTASTPSSPIEASRGSTLLHLLFGVRRARDLRPLLPGVLLALAVMLAALPLADLAGRAVLRWQGLDPTGKASPISGVLVAILLGALLRNSLPLPQPTAAGVQFCVTKILRLGIILVGIKLSLLDIARLGGWGLPIVVGTIAAGLFLTLAFNRLLGLSSELGTLMAAGTSICGVTAIVSTAGAIRASQRDVAYAVANITLFGLLGMLCYPHLAPLLLRTPEQVGLFLGTAIHDTSQVVGASLTYKELHGDDAAFKAATVTKLTRNLFLAVVVPLLAILHSRRAAADSPSAGSGTNSLLKLFPLFVLGFVVMAIVRTIGDAGLAGGGRAFGLFAAESWRSATAFLGETIGGRYALGTAMAAVGLGTNFGIFRTLGLKPLVVGLVGALLVGATGLGLTALLGRHVHLSP